MLDNANKLSCRLGPNSQGQYIDVEIDLVDYEIMCKQAVDEKFCDCQTGSLRLVNENAAEKVREEVYVSKITREDKEMKLDFKDESNVLAFILGIVVAILVISLVLLIAYLVIKKKRVNKTETLT